MKHFTSINDVPDLAKLLKQTQAIQANPFQETSLGENKTLGLVFMNPSLRTRLSTQKAAQNLGLSCMVLNMNAESWKLETQDGVVMNADKAEHIKDAAAVMGQYCDIIGIRTFAQLKNQEEDYQEHLLNQFRDYAGVPILSLESATLHPLQSLADILTIETNKPKQRPKVVLSWAP
ncbi:MAG: acetylornithine carbamoyltransferase, partial [Bacteroidota bacterium]